MRTGGLVAKTIAKAKFAASAKKKKTMERMAAL